MPDLLRTSGFNSIPGTPVLPLNPPAVPIPNIWNGLQFFIVPDLPDGYNHQLFPADYPNPYWRNKYGITMQDAAERLRWTAPDGDHSFAATIQVTGADTGFPLLSTATSDKINGRAVLTTSTRAYYLSMAGFSVSAATGPDLVANAALYTPSYTYACVFRAAPGAVGGLFGQSDGSAHTDAACGHRFGFPTGGDGTSLIYQHFGASAGNLLTINRNVANNLPTLAVVRFDASNRQGNVILINNGVRTTHYFAFPADVSTTTPTHPWMLLGYLNSASATSKRDFSLFSRWSRRLSEAENENLINFTIANYGPF